MEISDVSFDCKLESNWSDTELSDVGIRGILGRIQAKYIQYGIDLAYTQRQSDLIHFI